MKDRLSLTQAAKVLDMSPPTLRKIAIEKRQITCTVFGKRIWFRTEDLQKYVEESTLHAEPQSE